MKLYWREVPAAYPRHSGHTAGKTSKGTLFPFHGTDLLLGTALKEAVEDRDIEEIHPIENPLDILVQLILALCAEKPRNTGKRKALFLVIQRLLLLNRHSILMFNYEHF